MQYRVFNTGDQIWIKGGRSVKFISHDGLMWEEGQEHHTHVQSLYHVSSDGGQTWFGQRYGHFHVIKIASHDGHVWSEEDPVVRNLTGVEGAIHRAQTFISSLILKVLS